MKILFATAAALAVIGRVKMAAAESLSPTDDPLSPTPTVDPLSPTPTVDPLSPTPTVDPLSGAPSTSSAPSTSKKPTLAPTTSKPTGAPTTSKPTGAPTTSKPTTSKPTFPPTVCGGVRSCGIYPDPHYNIWDNKWYDFQGGCDQYAIDNPVLEVQIRTRPRTWYSTITQLAVKIKATGEVFRVNIDSQVENTITGTGIAQYSGANNSHKISLGDTNPPSYFQIYQSSYGISMQAYGCGIYFSGSEGMCGSWDQGGALFKDGTRFNLSGNYQDDKSRSPALAESWQVPVADSLLWDPSDICDPSSRCGSGETFACDADRRRLQVNTGCTRTCADITISQFRKQCEKDIELTGDRTWACAPAYINPVLATDRVIPGIPGFGKWYVDWTKEHCLQDCEVGIAASCGGRARNWNTLYDDAATCCQSRLPYKNLGWCEAESLGTSYPGSGKFYVDNKTWKCTKDCASGGPLDGNNDCGDVIEDGWVDLYNTARECCQGETGWQNPDLCASQSDPSSTGTNKFYVIQQDKKCAQDCVPAGGAPCAGPPEHPSAQLFGTATECCEEKLSWLSLDKCLYATNGNSGGAPGGSGQWYMNWELEKCVKDCVGGAPCGGLKETWDIGHASANACCNMMSWLPSDKCHA